MNGTGQGHFLQTWLTLVTVLLWSAQCGVVHCVRWSTQEVSLHKEVIWHKNKVAGREQREDGMLISCSRTWWGSYVPRGPCTAPAAQYPGLLLDLFLAHCPHGSASDWGNKRHECMHSQTHLNKRLSHFQHSPTFVSICGKLSAMHACSM